nr:DUF6359 domain-containing protein [Paenibacillus pini]
MNRNNRKRQWAASLVAILFVMVSVFNVLSGQASADTPLTVAQAIAKNNNGSNAVVEGFIVGEVFNSKPIFTNFGDDFNLLIADTPGEQDKTKLIDVQIPSNFRAQFGLKTNPTLVGKKIQVTGTLATYSSMNGINQQLHSHLRARLVGVAVERHQIRQILVARIWAYLLHYRME